MANITAKDVAALRAKTGCGMMECKKALVEANGDIDEATDLKTNAGSIYVSFIYDEDTNVVSYLYVTARP